MRNNFESPFATKMSDVTRQISTAREYFHELDLNPVFSIPPTAVAVAERLASYCHINQDNGRVTRRIYSQYNKQIDFSDISDDQIRLCFKVLDLYRLLPSVGIETGREIQIGLVVSKPYNDDEGWKWFVVINDGDLLVLNARHIDGHEILQAPTEKEIYSHWEEIDSTLQEGNLQGPIRLAEEASRYTNWQQILDTVPPLLP